jgi:hypothetical protein
VKADHEREREIERELEDTSYERPKGIHKAMDDINGATFLL